MVCPSARARPSAVPDGDDERKGGREGARGGLERGITGLTVAGPPPAPAGAGAGGTDGRD